MRCAATCARKWRPSIPKTTRRCFSSSYNPSAPSSSTLPTEAEIQSAQAYCTDLLRKFDTPSYTLIPFIPLPARPAYLSLRALNIELAQIPDSVSTPHVGSLRLQFWRDQINLTFSHQPPKHPVPLLLSSALTSLSTRTSGSATLSKSWLLRLISARETYLTNRPYTTLDELERYAENTYSTLLYLTLQALPLNSVTADHLASHIGKAAGIVAVLRGLPLLAFPAQGNQHANSQGLGADVAAQRVQSRQGTVTLPLDIMAEVGVREEDVLRHGAEAEGLRDAVFRVATRASDHLITARSMVKELRGGKEVGHGFEYEGEEGHGSENQEGTSVKGQLEEVERGWGIFMPAVSTELWLERLQGVDFDVFRGELRRREWKLPWRAYWAWSRRRF